MYMLNCIKRSLNHTKGRCTQKTVRWQVVEMQPTEAREVAKGKNPERNAASKREFLNESNSFFMREWFVYEAPFAWDGTNIKNYSNVKPASYGHFMNDWYNTYQVRDAWWENKTGSVTTSSVIRS
jgi:hypothetical protein